MRSNKPKTGLLITVLLMLAVLQLAVGLFAIFMVRTYRDQVEPETKVEDYAPQDDQDALEDEDVIEQEPNVDDQDDSDLDDEDEDDEDDDDEEEKDYVTMTVQAPDNYAAVRTGRGTTYEEVGRIMNGHKVALTDLKNGWYKIAKGKYKGYYTHQSSYVAG